MNITKLENENTEFHIPGYNYCGPGTKVFTRLQRGDVGINKLDEACKCHDIGKLFFITITLEYMMYVGDDDKLMKSDDKLRQVAQKYGGLASQLVDKIFLVKHVLESLGIISPSGFAKKLAKKISVADQRKLGTLLYKKYVLKEPNIKITGYY